MRARSLKPGLFKNEILGSADPLLSLLFEGLWLMADRGGRLEDRPLRICAELFPYRRTMTEKKTDSMLRWLFDEGFISRYEVAGRRYIQILEFSTHQNPHKNEAPSKIPVLSSTKHSASTRASTVPAPERSSASTEVAQDKHGSRPASSLTPSSLTPSSLTLVTPTRVQNTHAPDASRGNGQAKSADLELPESEHHERFERLVMIYPKFSGRQDLIGWEMACRQRIERDGATWDEFDNGATRYAAYVDAGGVSGPKFVTTGIKFFSAADRPWLQPWTPPPSKADQRLAGNLSAVDEFMRRTEESPQ